MPARANLLAPNFPFPIKILTTLIKNFFSILLKTKLPKSLTPELLSISGMRIQNRKLMRRPRHF